MSHKTNIFSSNYLDANIDLSPYCCGYEECEPGHFSGPGVREQYIIHYILDGKGFFQSGGITYQLGKGQGFLICPNQIVYYKADLKDPWVYSWVEFHGLNALKYLKRANLTADNPIFYYEQDDFFQNLLAQMLKISELQKSRDLSSTGLLYLFLAKLVDECGPKQSLNNEQKSRDLYVKKTIEYILMNYFRTISITDLAHYIGIDRKYLAAVFKKVVGMSPQQFLISHRIDKACELMTNHSLSIGDISRSVGYQDPLLFSKMFRKIKGLSPQKYRKINSNK